MQRDVAALIAARKIAGLTQTELAGRLGVSAPTIYRMEKGDKRVKTETWAKAAGALGLGFDWEKGEVVPGPKVPPAAIDRVLRDMEERFNGHDAGEPGVDPDTLTAPTVPTWDVDVSANAWADVPLCALDMNDPTQRRIIENGRFRLRILGGCMEPEYPSGMTIEFEIIRMDREALQIGADYVVCRSDGTGTFKRLVHTTEDSLTLAALNQKDFPGALLVSRQEVCRVAKVAFRLQPPPASKVPKIIAAKSGAR